jgi:outer membrane protein assembly factor BamD (BamD/ComL family)
MNMRTSERVEAGKEAVEYINEFLAKAGWELNSPYMLFIDPLSKAAYTADVAFIVQLNRDVNPIL